MAWWEPVNQCRRHFRGRRHLPGLGHRGLSWEHPDTIPDSFWCIPTPLQNLVSKSAFGTHAWTASLNALTKWISWPMASKAALPTPSCSTASMTPWLAAQTRMPAIICPPPSATMEVASIQAATMTQPAITWSPHHATTYTHALPGRFTSIARELSQRL